jgi:hypothetical protein
VADDRRGDNEMICRKVQILVAEVVRGVVWSAFAVQTNIQPAKVGGRREPILAWGRDKGEDYCERKARADSGHIFGGGGSIYAFLQRWTRSLPNSYTTVLYCQFLTLWSAVKIVHHSSHHPRRFEL